MTTRPDPAVSGSELPPKVQAAVHSDDVDFVTKAELRSVLGTTSATPEQVEEALALNAEARLRALRASFLIVSGIALLSIFPASRLPKYVPGELSAEGIVNETV